MYERLAVSGESVRVWLQANIGHLPIGGSASSLCSFMCGLFMDLFFVSENPIVAFVGVVCCVVQLLFLDVVVWDRHFGEVLVRKLSEQDQRN
jgi:hypothetical protein